MPSSRRTQTFLSRHIPRGRCSNCSRNPGFRPRVLPLFLLLLVSSCTHHPPAPHYEIRAPIPEGWQEVEGFTSTSLKLSRFESPLSAEGQTSIQLEQSKLGSPLNLNHLLKIEQSIQRARCPSSTTESFSSSEEAGFSIELLISSCWDPPQQAPLLSMTKYFLAKDQFRISVDFFPINSRLTLSDGVVRSWIQRWSTQLREVVICPLETPLENCGSS
jgi:hypothetical protein